MRKLLAKFKVGSITDYGNNNVKVNLSPVTNRDTEENKTFSIYTPSGSLEMHITNPSALNFFKPADEYLITFTNANDAGYVSIHNNSLKFQDWLSAIGIDFKPNGHFTEIKTDLCLFGLGAKWEAYKQKMQNINEKYPEKGE